MLFRKKKKYATQLTVGLRTQLCKECHDLQTRLCEVDGEACIFHRWIDEDRALLRVNCYVSPDEREFIVRRFKEDNFAPAGCSIDVVRNTLALVEYPDGSVGKVDPSLVTFLDKEVR